MGIGVDRDEFEESEYIAFARRLEEGLNALQDVLARPGWGQGERSVGAEIELALVDRDARPLPLNRAVLAESLDEHVTLELDRFNLEYNLTPVPAAGRPFSAFEDEMRIAIQTLDRVAAGHAGEIVPIGILPTLAASDLDSHAMSDLPRYRALSRALKRLRHEPFRIHINGPEPLTTGIDDVTMEGAATSLQLHLRVAPDEFADVYNAAQLATGPVLAVCANSPVFLGHRLWRETRVALFKQAVDPRPQHDRDWRYPARVGFGHGWVRHGALELFAETVAQFPPLIPLCTDEDALSRARGGQVPSLEELRLHMGTVWRWNRPVYDPALGGHLRIELRALPSGPTPIDCAANAAFLVGLTLGLSRDVQRLMPRIPFEYVHRNFYRAAEHGLGAGLVWPEEGPAPCLREVPAPELALSLLPVAEAGLTAMGVEEAEARRLLGVIRGRVERGQSGASWQLDTLAALEPRLGREQALQAMTRRYVDHAKSWQPVHEWGSSAPASA
ncbi:MAG: glutamate--cysteine ligase [Myxococcales bacterium]